jgi:hypothetical protein
MATINEAYSHMADINLWLKVQSGDDLMLADVPFIIPLRWNYFKENWEFIKVNLLEKVPQYQNPDFLNEEIANFSKFIESQRVGLQKVNPFSSGDILHKFHSVFENIEIQSINLTNEEDRILQSEIARVSGFTKNDFLDAKIAIIDYRDRITDSYNLADDDYNKAYGKSSIPPQINATTVEMNYLLVIQNMIGVIDFILVNLFAVDTTIDPFALARANANNPDIDIGQYSSGRLVRINYGENLQSLAYRYFGNADRWIDIAIANGLKAPYIDEVGNRISLLSNGNGNQINLSATDSFGQLNIDKLYINQPIFLQSDVYKNPDQRVIIGIKRVPVSGEIILELDGERNLDIYAILDNAHIRVFQPNTINSAFLILIPSQDKLDDKRTDDVPWFLAKNSEDEKRAKIDLLLDASGDLIFTTNNDIKLSYGLENAAQAIKLKIVTELGSLRSHPTFGLVNIAGTNNTNIEETKSIIIDSIVSQVQADSRFDRIEHISVDYAVNAVTNEGVGAMLINLSVRLAGGNQVIPISFTVNNV